MKYTIENFKETLNLLKYVFGKDFHMESGTIFDHTCTDGDFKYTHYEYNGTTLVTEDSYLYDETNNYVRRLGMYNGYRNPEVSIKYYDATENVDYKYFEIGFTALITATKHINDKKDEIISLKVDIDTVVNYIYSTAHKCNAKDLFEYFCKFNNTKIAHFIVNTSKRFVCVLEDKLINREGKFDIVNGVNLYSFYKTEVMYDMDGYIAKTDGKLDKKLILDKFGFLDIEKTIDYSIKKTILTIKDDENFVLEITKSRNSYNNRLTNYEIRRRINNEVDIVLYYYAGYSLLCCGHFNAECTIKIIKYDKHNNTKSTEIIWLGDNKYNIYDYINTLLMQIPFSINTSDIMCIKDIVNDSLNFIKNKLNINSNILDRVYVIDDITKSISGYCCNEYSLEFENVIHIGNNDIIHLLPRMSEWIDPSEKEYIIDIAHIEKNDFVINHVINKNGTEYEYIQRIPLNIILTLFNDAELKNANLQAILTFFSEVAKDIQLYPLEEINVSENTNFKEYKEEINDEIIYTSNAIKDLTFISKDKNDILEVSYESYKGYKKLYIRICEAINDNTFIDCILVEDFPDMNSRISIYKQDTIQQFKYTETYICNCGNIVDSIFNVVK